MTKKKRIVALSVVLLMLATSIFSQLDSPTFASIRTIDILRIFISGVLTGVLFVLLRGVLTAGKVENS